MNRFLRLYDVCSMVTHTMVIGKLLRSFAFCSIAIIRCVQYCENYIAVSKIVCPFFVCNIVENHVVASNILRAIAACSIVSIRVATRSFRRPFDACSVVKLCMAVSSLLSQHKICITDKHFNLNPFARRDVFEI